MSNEFDQKYGTIVAEMRRRKYTVDRKGDGVRIGMVGVTLIDYELDEEDLDTPVSDLCDDIEDALKSYLEDEMDEDIDDELRMNPEVARYIKRRNVSEKSKRLLKDDPQEVER